MSATSASALISGGRSSFTRNLQLERSFAKQFNNISLSYVNVGKTYKKKLRHYGINQLYLRKVPWYLTDWRLSVYISIIYIWGGFQNNTLKDILLLYIFCRSTTGRNISIKNKLTKIQVPNWQKYSVLVSVGCTFVSYHINYINFEFFHYS